MDGSHPCSLLFDAWSQKGLDRNQMQAEYDALTAELAACILDFGPPPESETQPPAPPMQQPPQGTGLEPLMKHAAGTSYQQDVTSLIACIKTIETLEQRKQRLVKQMIGRKIKGQE